MKKTLLALGTVVTLAFGLASCGNSDCVCTVKMLGVEQVLPTFKDHEGACDEIKSSDFPEQWQNIERLGGSFKCVEE